MEHPPNLMTLIAFLRQKTKLPQNPSYTSDVRHLLMSMNSESIDGIKQQFQANDNQINLQKFMWLISNAFPEELTNPLIYYELTKLFQDIDIDDSHTIEWSQFLEYLSSSNMISHQSNIEGNRVNLDKKILFDCYQEDIKYRKHPIRKIVEIQKNSVLAVINNDHLLEFVHYQRDKGKGKDYCLNFVDQKRVLSLDYAEKERMFGVLLSNRSICFVQDGEIQKNIGVIRPTGTQNDIRYLQTHKLWAVLSHNSTLQLFPSPKTTVIPKKIIFKPHNEPLTAVQEISNPHAICTASLDGTIKLWQAQAGKLIIQLSAGQELGLSQGEQKGVKGIATFSQGITSYICSWMFTFELFVWLPSLSLSKPFVGELKGHMGLVIDCVFSWKGQVLSLDDKRSIRVWNPQRLECNQILTTQQDTLKLFVLKGRPYLAAFSKLITFYRTKTDSKADLEMEMGISKKGERNVLARGEITHSTLLGTMFSQYYSALVVCTSLCTKILQVNTPTLLANFIPPREDEEYIGITPKGDRRVYLATSKGNILEHKIENGELVKMISTTRSSEHTLKFIHYDEELKVLLAVVQTHGSSFILTYDDNEPESDLNTIKQIEFQMTNLLFFKFNHRQHTFYILCEEYLTIWNYSRLIMTNKVRVKGMKLGHIIDMLIDEESGSILLVSEEDCFAIKVDQCHKVWQCLRFELEREKHEVTVGTALIHKEIQITLLEQIKTRKMALNSIHNTKPVTFKTRSKILSRNQHKHSDKTNLDSTSPTTLLMLANSKGELNFYNLTEHFHHLNFEYNVPKGNLHRIRQKRKTFISGQIQLDIGEPFDLSEELFTEKCSFVQKASECGSVNGSFYVFNDYQNLYFMDHYGMIQGEWNLNLSEPKRWSFYYNEIDNILKRLQMTEKSLAKIQEINTYQFKLDLLLQKYLLPSDKKQLKKYIDRMQESKGVTTMKVATSKYSLNLVEDSQGEVRMDSLVFFTQGKDKDKHNLFARKFSQFKETKKQQRKVGNLFYEKIEKNMKNRIAEEARFDKHPNVNSFEHSSDKISPLVQQLDYLCPNNPQPYRQTQTETASAHSKKKQVRGQSLLERPRTSILTPQKSTVKPRIKSSMSNLSKHFSQNKIEYRNFMQKNAKILASTEHLLKKRGKLQL